MKFRFFLDWGSGIVLWSADDETREKYDYAVDHHDLPLSKELLSEIDKVLNEYDNSFDPMENVHDGTFNISESDKIELNNRIHAIAKKIQIELVSKFEVEDEYLDI